MVENNERISVPMNPARVCDAIAKIGYSSASAILDIVDNSVQAGATKIIIELISDEDKTYAAQNNVLSFRIIDNGSGMTDDQIVNSLKLGSDSNYPDGSLSKYGMGLKSAGLSLGLKIQVFSKSYGNYSQLYFIDRDILEAEPEYFVCREVPDEVLVTSFENIIQGGPCGTLVEIHKCDRRFNSSAKKIIDDLIEKIGATYYYFMKRVENPLAIIIRCTGKDEIIVSPFDIIFLSDSQNGFDPDTYDCKTPCKVLDEDLPIKIKDELIPVKIEAVIFPRDAMKSSNFLNDTEKALIQSFRVTRKNKGFYIYRNERLICWAESLKDSDGKDIIGKDLLGFRGRINITTNHDDILHVDVSKQRLNMPEEFCTSIKRLVHFPKKDSELAFELCKQVIDRTEEGEKFNENTQDLTEEDYAQPEGEKEVKEAKERKKKIEEKTKIKLEEDGDVPAKIEPPIEKIPVFAKIRYSEKVKSTMLWEPGQDPTDGSFVRINKNHPFYTAILSQIHESSAERQAIETIFWTCAAAENLTIRNMPEIDEEVISKVLHKFKDLVGYNLNNFVSKSKNIFNND